jgi:hypothetical protein
MRDREEQLNDLVTKYIARGKRIAELEAENKRLLGEIVKGNERDTHRAAELHVLNMLVDTLQQEQGK